MSNQKNIPPISNVPRETLEMTLSVYSSNNHIFEDLIGKWLWWNKSVNLFSRNTSSADLKNHILHSLLLLDFDFHKGANIIDAGTGGGFPGLPMAISDTEKTFKLVDNNSRKNLALKNIIRSLGLNNVSADCKDIAGVHFNEPYHVVTKHAFHIKDLLKALGKYHWLDIHFLKGDDFIHELKDVSHTNYSVSVKKIDWAQNDFFNNKYIVSIMNKTIRPPSYE